MNRDNLFEEVKTILADELEKDPASITMESHLINDLELDSLDAFDFFNAVSEKYNIEVDASQATEIQTINDVVNLLESNLSPSN